MNGWIIEYGFILNVKNRKLRENITASLFFYKDYAHMKLLL